METRELGIKELQYVSLLPNKSSPPIYFVQYTLTKKKTQIDLALLIPTMPSQMETVE